MNHHIVSGLKQLSFYCYSSWIRGRMSSGGSYLEFRTVGRSLSASRSVQQRDDSLSHLKAFLILSWLSMSPGTLHVASLCGLWFLTHSAEIQGCTPQTEWESPVAAVLPFMTWPWRSYFWGHHKELTHSKVKVFRTSPSPPRIMAAAEGWDMDGTWVKSSMRVKQKKPVNCYRVQALLPSSHQSPAGNTARKNHLEASTAIAYKLTSCILQLLEEAGMKTAFTKKCGETAFIAPKCEMIPIVWVCRRIPMGAFLKRNPGVKEGYMSKFYPPKMEGFQGWGH